MVDMLLQAMAAVTSLTGCLMVDMLSSMHTNIPGPLRIDMLSAMDMDTSTLLMNSKKNIIFSVIIWILYFYDLNFDLFL